MTLKNFHPDDPLNALMNAEKSQSSRMNLLGLGAVGSVSPTTTMRSDNKDKQAIAVVVEENENDNEAVDKMEAVTNGLNGHNEVESSPEERGNF